MFVSIKKDRWFRAVFRGLIDKQWSYMNTRIEDLLEEYEMDGEFDYDRYIHASYRYVRTMQDSQVRCLLYVLAKELGSIKSNNKEN